MEQQESMQLEKRTLSSRFKSFILQCKRVFQITKKPTKEELKVIVKVTAIGIAVIGAIGFIIHISWELLK
nr:protein translocase SEC61 complex subunit gamma [Nanoarchaeum sp.]